MAIWKQALVAIVLMLVAGFGWLRLDPGASATLARFGLDLPVVMALAATPPEPETVGANARRGGGMGGRGGGFGGPQSVVIETAGMASVNDRISAIGDGQAVNSVMVTPYSAGNVDAVLVRSGQVVEAGDVIVELDAAEQTIAVERARLSLEDAETTLERYRTLRASSASSIAAVEITTAELAVQTARLQLREAELNLQRRSVIAPLGGVVGIVAINPGDYLTTSTEVVTIDDRSEILVDFWVPERFASVIQVGQPLDAKPISQPGASYDGVVTAIDNRIDQASRTLRVRATIPNDDDRLRAGMSFTVAMTFNGDDYPTVNPLSVQWSNEGAYVWRVVDETTERVPIAIIQRNAESVLVDAALEPGDPIIIEGLIQLREGARVAVAGSQGAPASEGDQTPVAGAPTANQPATPRATGS
jgi:RND family efflux transporter MFP subunit